MKQSKGFTLIELLAVIVILAIIALIATPIIMGVIEDARIQADKDSALGYVDAVEQAIALELTKDPSLAPDGTQTVVNEISFNSGNKKIEIKNYKGKTPDAQNLTYSGGKLKGSVTFNGNTGTCCLPDSKCGEELSSEGKNTVICSGENP